MESLDHPIFLLSRCVIFDAEYTFCLINFVDFVFQICTNAGSCPLSAQVSVIILFVPSAAMSCFIRIKHSQSYFATFLAFWYPVDYKPTGNHSPGG